MRMKQLKEIQKIFIEEKDWEEVSKIQFEIDCLPESERLPNYEPWFLFAINQYEIKLLNEYLEKLIELGKTLEEKGEIL